MNYLGRIQISLLKYLKKYPLVELSEGRGGARRSVMYLTGTGYKNARRTMDLMQKYGLVFTIDILGTTIYKLTDKGSRIADVVIKYEKDINPRNTPMNYIELLANLESGVEVSDGIDFLLSPCGLMLKRTKDVVLTVKKKTAPVKDE